MWSLAGFVFVPPISLSSALFACGARIMGTVGREAILISALSVLELAGAAVGALSGGLTGLTLGWVAAIAVEVVVLAPMVWRAYRGRLEVPAR